MTTIPVLARQEGEHSPSEQLALLPPDEREAWLRTQTPGIIAQIRRGAWWWRRRPKQCEPAGDWLVWVIGSGRGWGKNETGSNTLAGWADSIPFDRHGNRTEWLIVAEKLADVRALNIEGPSGILNALKRLGYRQVDRKPRDDNTEKVFTYTKAPKPQLILYPHGQIIHTDSAESGGADVGRGYNLAGLWMDEVAKWGPVAHDAWYDGLLPALRSDLPYPHHPRCIVTTTPKPIGLLRDWWERARKGDPEYRLTIGSTYENAGNLNPHTLKELIREYEGTRKGRQELHGELLDEVDGALWSRELLEACRAPMDKAGHYVHPELIRIAVGMDPAGTGEGAEQGLVVIGQDAMMEQWVIGDHSKRVAGKEGAELAWRTLAEYRRYLPRHRRPVLVVEEDYGKKWLKDTLELVYKQLQQEGLFDPYDPMPVEYAKASLLGGKDLRAEPVVTRYEAHRVHHVGVFAELERQQCTWDRNDPKAPSPDRVDGLVHASLWLRDQEPKQASSSEYLDNMQMPVTNLEGLGFPA